MSSIIAPNTSHLVFFNMKFQFFPKQRLRDAFDIIYQVIYILCFNLRVALIHRIKHN